MTEWFRSWHGAPTDTKWLTIARRAGVVPGIVSAVAWALLDHASQSEPRGDVSAFDPETYAAFSGFDEAAIAAVIAAMIDKRVIVDGRLTNWEKRQPLREDRSTERVRAFRERKRAGATTEETTEQSGTQGNAEERKRTPATPRAETETAPPRTPEPTRSDLDAMESRLRQAAGYENEPAPRLLDLSPILNLLDAGVSMELDVIPTIKAKAAALRHTPSSWAYFRTAILEAHSRRTAPVVMPAATSPPPARTQWDHDRQRQRALVASLDAEIAAQQAAEPQGSAPHDSP